MNEDKEKTAKLNWNMFLVQNWRESVQLFVTDEYDFSFLARKVIDEVIDCYLNDNEIEGMEMSVELATDRKQFSAKEYRHLVADFVNLLSVWTIVTYVDNDRMAYIPVMRLVVHNEQTNRLELHFSEAIIDALTNLSSIN